MAAVAAAEEGDKYAIFEEEIMNSNPSHILNRALLVILATLLAGVVSAQPAAPPQKGFSTPQLAVDELLKAADANDLAALQELFGPNGKDLVSTGDPVQDKNYIAAFAAKAREKKAVVVDPRNSSRAILSLGAEDWPAPVPIVKRKGKWYFDSEAGRREILNRRIGANELDAIQTCRLFAEAQWEYASSAQDSSITKQFAQRIISSPGKRDGLYWLNEDGTPGGPLSEEVAKAIQEGYSPGSGYHGYHFKVLKGQGKAAPLGELDYVIGGIMIGGFALMAVPIDYDVTGVKTFMISHQGIVYEKDLGPDTLSIAKGIERYDPDKTWRRTDDGWPSEDAAPKGSNP